MTWTCSCPSAVGRFELKLHRCAGDWRALQKSLSGRNGNLEIPTWTECGMKSDGQFSQGAAMSSTCTSVCLVPKMTALQICRVCLRAALKIWRPFRAAFGSWFLFSGSKSVQPIYHYVHAQAHLIGPLLGSEKLVRSQCL